MLESDRGEPRMSSRQLWFTMHERHDNATMYLHGDAVTYAPIAGDPRPAIISSVSEIPLAGLHNVQNVMAALLAAFADRV